MNRGAAILVAGITALVVTGAALAAKQVPGSPKSSSTIALVMLADDGSRAPGAQPTFGDQVTYDVSTGATEEPYVETTCFQNGTLVSKQSRGFFDGYYAGTQVFTLGPTDAWQGGAATCQARLVMWVNGKDRTLASMSFDVAA